MIGVPGPRLLPEFSPVIESTELGRSLPRRVASATASRICCFIQIWLAPTGTFTSKVGMPVSWQIGPSQDSAWSMFCAMIVIAWPERVTATVHIKRAMALANASLGRLDRTLAQAIVQATDEILAGSLRDQFVVDVYQAGAGTSHNMNTNEVLANRAAEILGAPRGEYSRVHPNDHVNMGQSTNDVFPTATRLAVLSMLPDLLAAARELADGLAAKAREFDSVL